jgi:TonB family protein
VPQGIFWLEAETIAPDGTIVQWWKVINLFRLPFRLRVAAQVASTNLGPTVSTTQQFCTTPPPRVGAAAFANDKPPLVPGRIYLPNEVDSAAAQAPNSAMPVYPATLRASGVSGAVTARFVLDPDGRVQTETIQIVRSDHPDFSDAVRTALSRARYLPAILHGVRVHTLVTQSFTFSITTRPL